MPLVSNERFLVQSKGLQERGPHLVKRSFPFHQLNELIELNVSDRNPLESIDAADSDLTKRLPSRHQEPS